MGRGRGCVIRWHARSRMACGANRVGPNAWRLSRRPGRRPPNNSRPTPCRTEIVKLDPEFHDGFYRRFGTRPRAGLALARQVGMLQYRARDEFNERFGRARQDVDEGPYAIESYFSCERSEVRRIVRREQFHHARRRQELRTISGVAAGAPNARCNRQRLRFSWSASVPTGSFRWISSGSSHVTRPAASAETNRWCSTAGTAMTRFSSTKRG